MNDFLEIVVAAFVGTCAARYVTDKVLNKIQNRYKWTCPDPSCQFSVSTNLEEMCDSIKNAHMVGHLPAR